MKEKLEATKSRFEKANEGKGEWYNEPTKDFYFKKFSDALESEEYAGQSDVDILHSLTKDDQTARKGVTAVKLAGGTPQGVGGKSVTREDFYKMSYKERLQIYNENQALYNELTT